MASRQLTPELHPVERIASAAVTLVTLALFLTSVVTLRMAVSP